MDAALLQRLAKITPEETALRDGAPLDRELYARGGGPFRVDCAKMLEEGRLIAVRPHTRFVAFPIHSHNYIEIMYVCAGQVTHIVNRDHTVRVDAGELLLLNARSTHAIQRADAGDVAVNLIVLPQFFEEAFHLIGTDNVLWGFLSGGLRDGSAPYLHFKVADVLPVQNLLENLVWSVVTNEPNARRITQNTMALLFLQLLNHTDRMEMPSLPRVEHTLVLAVLREIEDNYREASLSRVADEHGISLAYVSACVREVTGKTYKELLQTRRLDAAAQLLRRSALPVQEVIARVGYENTSYFYRLFRERFGTGPKDYRKGSSNYTKTEKSLK